MGMIPHNGARVGIPTVADLRARFKVVRKEVLKAALIPENSHNFVGHMVGEALAKLNTSVLEAVKVPAADEADKGVNDHLENISQCLDASDLKGALVAADQIDGYSRSLMRDWEAHVGDRL